MNSYAYCIMIRQNVDNCLLRFRRLFQLFSVDMYTKIAADRILFICLTQNKLCTEEYIHLSNAIFTEENAADFGRMTILPSSFVRRA